MKFAWWETRSSLCVTVLGGWSVGRTVVIKEVIMVVAVLNVVRKEDKEEGRKGGKGVKEGDNASPDIQNEQIKKRLE